MYMSMFIVILIYVYLTLKIFIYIYIYVHTLGPKCILGAPGFSFQIVGLRGSRSPVARNCR